MLGWFCLDFRIFVVVQLGFVFEKVLAYVAQAGLKLSILSSLNLLNAGNAVSITTPGFSGFSRLFLK